MTDFSSLPAPWSVAFSPIAPTFHSITSEGWQKLARLLEQAILCEGSICVNDIAQATGLDRVHSILLVNELANMEVGSIRALVFHHGCEQSGMEDRNLLEMGLPHPPWICPGCQETVQRTDDLRFETALRPKPLNKNPC